VRAMRRAPLEKSRGRKLQNEARRILYLFDAADREASRTTISPRPSYQLPSEEMRGPHHRSERAANIKSFESATGVTLLIDESPQMVLVSVVRDPVRRDDRARRRWTRSSKTDGYNPASIEEFVKRAQDERNRS